MIPRPSWDRELVAQTQAGTEDTVVSSLVLNPYLVTPVGQEDGPPCGAEFPDPATEGEHLCEGGGVREEGDETLTVSREVQSCVSPESIVTQEGGDKEGEQPDKHDLLDEQFATVCNVVARVFCPNMSAELGLIKLNQFRDLLRLSGTRSRRVASIFLR